jgi:hypothetical protein
MNQISPQDKRQAEQELLSQVQRGRLDPAIQALCKLLELRLRKFQDKMLQCQVDDFLALQTEARVLMKLLGELKLKIA